MNDRKVKQMINEICDATECQITAQDIIEQTNFFTKKRTNFYPLKKMKIIFASVTVCLVLVSLFLGFNIGGKIEKSRAGYDVSKSKSSLKMEKIVSLAENHCKKLSSDIVMSSNIGNYYNFSIYEGYKENNEVIYFFAISKLGEYNDDIIIETANESLTLNEKENYGILCDRANHLDKIEFTVKVGDFTKEYSFSR